MSELSPAAKAVQATVDAMYWDWGNMMPSSSDAIAAAALRAAADHLFPEPDDWVKDNMSEQGLWLLRLKRDQLLAIATELEAQ
jgi:hypothetical protein